MDDRGVLLGAAGSAMRRLRRAEQEQGDRRARARMMSAAPLPPSIYNPRFKRGGVGSSAHTHSTTPQ